MFGMPGGSEWIVLVLLILLLFGSARLPRLARSMREAKDEFQKGKNEDKDEAKKNEGSPVPEAHTEKPEAAPTKTEESSDRPGE